MDRFIEMNMNTSAIKLLNLKSNMDRFIDGIHIHFDGREDNLKSNMDRFIVDKSSKILFVTSI